MRPSTLAPHAPYSVSPALFRAIAGVDREPFAPCSVHLAESAEEVEFLRDGHGRRGASCSRSSASWIDGVGAARRRARCEYPRRLRASSTPRLLAVHGVQMSTEPISRGSPRAGATLVTCPRSNAWTGAGAPPIERFYDSGVRVAVGTDSLASVADLNVFAELATMRALAPTVPAAALLDSATRQGARALGFDADYGTIEPGKRARLLAVALPAGHATMWKNTWWAGIAAEPDRGSRLEHRARAPERLST